MPGGAPGVGMNRGMPAVYVPDAHFARARLSIRTINLPSLVGKAASSVFYMAPMSSPDQLFGRFASHEGNERPVYRLTGPFQAALDMDGRGDTAAFAPPDSGPQWCLRSRN